MHKGVLDERDKAQAPVQLPQIRAAAPPLPCQYWLCQTQDFWTPLLTLAIQSLYKGEIQCIIGTVGGFREAGTGVVAEAGAEAYLLAPS